MVKIYEMDEVLFAKPEREKTITPEIAMVKDRMLRYYRWFISIDDNWRLIMQSHQNGSPAKTL
jgi:hypothetical protein